MDSKLLKILTGVAAVSAVGAPATAFASPVKAAETENTNTETTTTAGDVKTTDQALADTKKEAQKDTAKSEAADANAKTDAKDQAADAKDAAAKDNTSDNQADNTNTDAKNETAGDQGKTDGSSQISRAEKELKDYIQKTSKIDIHNLDQYSLNELQDFLDNAYYYDNNESIKQFIEKQPGYANQYEQANIVTRSVSAYLDGLGVSQEISTFQDKMKTIDTSTPEGMQEALKAYNQLSPRIQEYVRDYSVLDNDLSMRDIFKKDPEIKPLIDMLDDTTKPDWNAFFKQYNQLSPEKKAIVNNVDYDKIKSNAELMIEKSIDDANKSKQSDELKNFLADFAEAAANPTSQSMDQLAKEYLSLSKADQAYVQSHLEGAYDYFGLDDAVAKAQKSDQKESGKDNTAQKGSTVTKKLTAVLENAKAVTSAAPKTGDTTDALPEILALIAGIGGAAGVGIFKTRKEKKAFRR